MHKRTACDKQAGQSSTEVLDIVALLHKCMTCGRHVGAGRAEGKPSAMGLPAEKCFKHTHCTLVVASLFTFLNRRCHFEKKIINALKE